MSLERILYVDSATADDLYEKVEQNLSRYTETGFTDLAEAGGWSNSLSTVGNLSLLETLDPAGSPAAEAENSLIVWRALRNLTPSLACENRIWIRLCHIECIEYARERWLKGVSADSLVDSIQLHFFANTQTKWRDDNAISRLWWNAYIAPSLCEDDMVRALNLFLKRADIRSNFIERSWITSRKQLSRGILRLMENVPWVTSKEINFREFMKKVNQYGGRYVFEVMPDREIDRFLSECANAAQTEVHQSTTRAEEPA